MWHSRLTVQNWLLGERAGSITIWNLTSGNRRPTFRFGSQVTRCLAFTPDGRLLATGSTDHGIALWDAMTLEKSAAFGSGSAQINCVTFSADGRTLAAALQMGLLAFGTYRPASASES